ncbi:MAG: hypothetical protein Q8O55_09575, partial [Dehalococcoidales bacterium]|nr:hypothetical protein [Dehalococcoidales bacterium]
VFRVTPSGEVEIGATTTISGNVLPSITSTYNLGSPAYKWGNIYAATGTFGGTITINTDTISATSTLTITAASTTLISSANTLTASSSQAMIFNTAGSERMRILSTGEIGIGTTTPAYTLDVYGTLRAFTSIQTASSSLGTVNSGIWQGTAIADAYIPDTITIANNATTGTQTMSSLSSIGTITTGVWNAGALTSSGVLTINGTANSMIAGTLSLGTTTSNGIFYVATSTPMFTILQNGNVGIGTAGPSAPLDIKGNIRFDNTARYIEFSDGAGTWDTNLYRSGANSLKTDDDFTIGTGGEIKNLNISAFGAGIYFGGLGSFADSPLYGYGGGWYTVAAITSGAAAGDATFKIPRSGTITPTTASTFDLGSTAKEWNNLYIGTGRAYFGAGQESSIYASSNDLILSPTGNIGIGTTSPAYTLDVYGTLRAFTSIQTASSSLGTVNSGIWQGTAIADAYIPDTITIANNATTGTALSVFSGSVTDGQVPDTITLTNITQITNRDLSNLQGTLSIASTTGTLTYDRGGTGTSTALALQNLWWGTGSGGLVQVASSTLAGVAGTTYDPQWITSGTSLYASSTFSKVGIGTTSPAYTLDTYGTFRALSTSTFGGFVGIGTTTPGYTLSVVGNIYGSGNAIFGGTLSAATTTITGDFLPATTTTYNLGSSAYKWKNLYVGTTTIGSTITIGSANITSDTALNLTGVAASIWQTTGSASALTIQSASTTLISSANTLTASSTQAMIFATAATERMRILSTGEVGIGTT